MNYRLAERLGRMLDLAGKRYRRHSDHLDEDDSPFTGEALDQAAQQSRRRDQRFFDGLDQRRHGGGHAGWG